MGNLPFNKRMECRFKIAYDKYCTETNVNKLKGFPADDDIDFLVSTSFILQVPEDFAPTSGERGYLKSALEQSGIRPPDVTAPQKGPAVTEVTWIPVKKPVTVRSPKSTLGKGKMAESSNRKMNDKCNPMSDKLEPATKPAAQKTVKPTSQPKPLMADAVKSGKQTGNATARPRTPIPDHLKTTEHTIVLDPTNPNYSTWTSQDSHIIA
jgi:hypothetical protein